MCNSRILIANLSWSPTCAKFCLLIATLSVVLPQFNLIKLKLEYLKSGLKRKKDKQTKFFVSLEFSSSLLLENGRKRFAKK